MSSHLLDTAVPIESLGKALERIHGAAVGAVDEQRTGAGGAGGLAEVDVPAGCQGTWSPVCRFVSLVGAH